MTIQVAIKFLSYFYNPVLIFFSYLTNRELGILDRVITDINLRKIYIQQAGQFYSKNKIKFKDELKWIMKRGIVLTKCHLDFDFEGKNHRYIHHCLHTYSS